VGTHRLSVHVAAPPERVFDLWTDLDRMKEWVGGVTRISDVSGPVARVGTRYTVWFGGMRSRTEVLEAERPRRFRTRFGNAILRGENSVTLEPEGNGTRIDQEFRTQGIVAAIAAWIFARGSYRGSFQGELNAFARLAESEPGGRSGLR
jgi:uncharacterized protein YndB with AHSA1/START domain